MAERCFHCTAIWMKKATLYEFPYIGIFLNKILMIGSMDILIMSGFEYVCLSNLTVSLGINYRSFWSLCFASVSNLNCFPKCVVNCNHSSASVIKLLDWL